MTVRSDYEVSSEGAVRHWEFTKTRLENTSPVATEPFALQAISANVDQLTGTVLTSITGDTKIVGDVTPSMVYKHYVRNVLTYAQAAEATFGAISEGDLIYYDRSATMPTGVYLSTSPLDASDAANPLFGRAVLLNEDDTFDKGGATASTQTVAVMQRGAGG